MNRLAALALGAALSIALAACGSANADVPSGAAGGPADAAGAVHIDAKDIAFTESNVTAPAGRGFSLVFTSADTAPHNVTIVAADGSVAFTGDVVSGPASKTYSVPALAPGTYTFRCDIHPSMTGTLTVQ